MRTAKIKIRDRMFFVLYVEISGQVILCLPHYSFEGNASGVALMLVSFAQPNKKGYVPSRHIPLLSNLKLHRRRRAGIAKKQGHQHAQNDRDEARYHPQTPAAGELAGDDQPAKA